MRERLMALEEAGKLIRVSIIGCGRCGTIDTSPAPVLGVAPLLGV